MSVIPRDLVAKIEFFESHNSPWSTNAVAIGTTTTEVTALNTKTTAARTALSAQQAAQDAAKAATLALNGAVDAMVTAGSNILKEIKAKAASAGDSVYVLAQIPPPATPGPVAAPGTPTDFTVELLQDGSLVLKWKCANPANASGTVYQVSRRIGTSGSFTFIGATGNKKFTDATLPTGSASATYQIVAIRSTAQGAPAQFTVNFGVSGGEMTAMLETAPRLAA